MRVFLASGGTLTPIGTCAPEPILTASHGIHPSPTQIRRVATTRLGWKVCTDSDVTTDPETVERAVVVGTLGEANGLAGWIPEDADRASKEADARIIFEKQMIIGAMERHVDAFNAALGDFNNEVKRIKDAEIDYAKGQIIRAATPPERTVTYAVDPSGPGEWIVFDYVEVLEHIEVLYSYAKDANARLDRFAEVATEQAGRIRALEAEIQRLKEGK